VQDVYELQNLGIAKST